MFSITDNLEQNTTTASLFKRAVRLAGLEMDPFDPQSIPAPEWAPATAQDLADAAYKAAAAGKDPAADKDVQRLLLSKLLADQIGGLHYRHQLAASRAELEHYKAQAPALLDDLASAFEDAVVTLSTSAEVLGHMDLADGLRQLDNMPDRKASAVAAAHAANARAGRLTEALPMIVAAATGWAPTGGKYALLTYTAPSLAQFNEHHLSGHSAHNNHGHRHNAWDLINDGVPLSLATTREEVQARINRIENDLDDLGHDYRAEAAQHAEARAQAKAMGFN